jgi:hypothetical protein
MTDERRNPYVILGIPFGAGEAEARTGFAKANRRLRGLDNSRYSMEDLTWALHQVEQMIEDPSKAFHVYRVPADSDAAAVQRPGVFSPLPNPIERQTEASTDEEREAVKMRAISELVRDALTTEIASLAIPKPYEMKEPTND